MKKVLTAGGLLINGRDVRLVRLPGGLVIPKGHLEDDETPEQAAVREMREETGFEVVIVKHLGTVTRKSHEDSGELVEKDIEVYLMRIIGLSDAPTEEESEWINIEDALTEMKHVEEMQFLLNNEYLFDID